MTRPDLRLSLTLEPSGDRDLVVVRRFAAPPQRVFHAFTEASAVEVWMGTPAWPIVSCTADVRPGGAFRYMWRGEEGEMAVSGTYVEVVPGERTVHTELFDEDWTGGEVRVTTEFVDLPPFTEVRMTLRYTSAEARDAALTSGMAKGMHLNYIHLDEFLAGRLQHADFVVDPELDLVVERVVPVPPSAVWRAWTEADLLVQWFTPAPWSTAAAELDVRPGGRFHTVMQSPEGEQFPGTGCYLEVIPERRLVWTDGMGPGYRPQEGGLFTGILLLEAVPEGTRYRAIARHGDPGAAKQHADMGFVGGWNAALDQLVALMS